LAFGGGDYVTLSELAKIRKYKEAYDDVKQQEKYKSKAQHRFKSNED